jgi:hypothetical protein
VPGLDEGPDVHFVWYPRFHASHRDEDKEVEVAWMERSGIRGGACHEGRLFPGLRYRFIQTTGTFYVKKGTELLFFGNRNLKNNSLHHFPWFSCVKCLEQ